jgi:hypothetical protein
MEKWRSFQRFTARQCKLRALVVAIDSISKFCSFSAWKHHSKRLLNIMTKPTGFIYTGEFNPNEPRNVLFMECKGKDISFPRWRIALYYAAHLAETHFSYSEADYNAFIAKHAPFCFSDFTEFSELFEPKEPADTDIITWVSGVGLVLGGQNEESKLK